MRRIGSGGFPAATRLLLRERLSRFLPHEPTTDFVSQGPARAHLVDAELVAFLLNLQFHAGDDVAVGRLVYEEARMVVDAEQSAAVARVSIGDAPARANAGESVNSAPTPAPVSSSNLPVTPEPAARENEPAVSVSERFTDAPASLAALTPPLSFDELIEHGWVRVSWERISIPRDIVFAVLRDESASAAAFKALVQQRGKDALTLSPGFSPSGALRDIASDVMKDELRLSEIACVSPAWVAATLWDKVFRANDRDATQKMGFWVDRWELLGWPRFSMNALLSPDAQEGFVETALTLATAAGATPGWADFRRAACAPTVLLYPHRAAAIDNILPPVPATTIERSRWMSGRIAEIALQDYMESRAWKLVSALLNEVQVAAYDPRGVASRLLSAAVHHPIHLQQFVLRASRAPALLADLLMEPVTAPLACSLIAGWDHRGGGRHRELEARANRVTGLLAVEDAVSMLGGHLDEGRVSPEELALLYLHVFELAYHHRPDARRPEMLPLLRDEILGAAAAVQQGVVATLLERARSGESPLAPFCALLDLASEGGSADQLPAEALVGVYLDVLLPRGEPLSPGYLEATSSAALTELAFRCDRATRSRFLDAVDIQAWLQSAPASQAERPSFIQQVVRRVRLHIRVLSRAVAGWPVAARPELAEALTRTVICGAVERPERHRLDAFALGFHFGDELGVRERLIALDLSDALLRLEGLAQQNLLAALCQVEEPAVLAGVVANVPEEFSTQLRAHLQTLTPANSSVVHTLPALQVRVEALLEAGMPALAARFVEAERAAITGRHFPNRAVTALRAQLLSLYLTEAWTEVMSFQLPATIPESERQDANDALSFYRALVHLRMPGGDARWAEAEFLRLSQRSPAATSYLTNLFASRVQRLLAQDSLRLLSGEELAEAVRTIGEVQRDIRPALRHSTRDLNTLDMNLVMLMLAVGRPREGLQMLLELREKTYEPKVEGFRALALARVGSTREALAVLTQAEQVFGRSGLLSGIRENIDGHRPFRTAPALSLDDNPVPGLRQAYENILRLGHAEQAEVLEARGRLDLFLLEHVRGACASLVALVPMMRNLGVLRREDDINSMLTQILLSRLLHVQWEVSDQSRGGYSRTGGVGERDLVVRKGSATLAIIEALIVDSVETCNLTSHFNKLLGYDTCRLFFLVTYARRADCSGVLRHLKTACQAPPAGFSHIRSEDLLDSDSMPVGFKAQYNINTRYVEVVFLVLDMNQQSQRTAAATQ